MRKLRHSVFLGILALGCLIASCHPRTTIIWNEGVQDEETGLVENTLLICNAPKGVDWDLWGHFYNAHKLPCKASEGSMAHMYHHSGSCWRVEPQVEGDTLVMKYWDKRYKHSYAPRGFYIRLRGSKKVFTVPVEQNFQPCEGAERSEVPFASLAVTDIVPAVKSVVPGEGASKVETVEERILEGLRPEGYIISVGEGKALIEASDQQGLRYGRLTLDKFKENAGSDTLPDMVVEDWPDFAYRAQMIDVARLYYPLDELKSFVNVLARCKVNTLALHLNDDEGWRIEIDGLPELTSYGAFHDVPVRL